LDKTMSDSREAGTVVTSENIAEFTAQKLGLADRADTEADNSEPDQASEQSEPKSEDEAKTGKQNPKLEKRFSEITKQREQAREEAKREREARESLEAKVAELERRRQPQQRVETLDEEPKPEQFNDAFEYARALAEYSAEQALKNRDRVELEKKYQAEHDKLIEVWNDRLETTKKELPDYQDMIESSDVMVSDQVRDALLESDAGPRILYHLAENPDYAEKLSKMTVISALREIGKLEARFEKTETKPVVRSKAPAPINPLRATGGSMDTSVGSDGEFHGTYSQWREARKAGKIR
jgi:FtsZ-interacting cell division protein YlmF